ncbi:MAG: glycosyltransferase family 2 protein, partial [Gemmatimonadales bacterium]
MTDSVSVVIPTHNRRASLERLLGTLASQTWHPQLAEIIVVADGCNDDTVAAVPDRAGAAPVRVIELAGCGAAIARNTGAESAVHELLIFLDDDMEPGSDLIERYAAAAAPGVVLLGASYAHRNGAAFLDAGVRAWWEEHFRNLERPGHRYSYHDMLSGNFAITRSDFLALGGFDTGLRCREDYEFGIRLLRAGLAMEYLPAARTIHHESPSLQVSLRRAENEGCADTGIIRLHPSVRSTLLLSRYRDRRRRWPAAVLNSLAFRARGAGDLCARILRAGLGLTERLKMRGKWRRIYGALREYHYWCGVVGVVGNEASLKKLAGPGGLSLPDELIVDLSAGVERAKSELHRRRPDSLRIIWGGIPIGRIPPMPGGEPLDSRHLVPALRGHMADRLAGAMALSSSTPATEETCGLSDDWGNSE